MVIGEQESEVVSHYYPQVGWLSVEKVAFKKLSYGPSGCK